MSIRRLKAAVRDIPDFPKPGILFKDITPVLKDPKLFRAAVDLFAKRHRDKGIRKIAVIDARGFLFGAALAYKLKAGVVPIRKRGNCLIRPTRKVMISSMVPPRWPFMWTPFRRGSLWC